LVILRFTDKTIMEDDGNIYYYRDDALVRITVLNASKSAGVSLAS
jgi:DNA-binding transcriptional MerR regulator